MSREIPCRPIHVLLVEDSPSDVLLAKNAFQQAKLHISLAVVEDGVDALAYLRRKGDHADAPKPDLILLDLNLPRKDGREVLAEIKTDASLYVIPVVVLTTSKSEEDVLKTYGLHANCYVTKPIDFAQFVEVVHSIEQFWFTVVTLPGGEAHG